MSLMRDGLLRSSEAADLVWGDLQEQDDGTGLLLIKRSKTDQEGKGFHAFVSSRTMALLAAIREDAQPTHTAFSACAATRSPTASSRRRKPPALEMASADTRPVWAWRRT